MDQAAWTALFVNAGILVATAGASAVAWWQAIEASHARNDARDAEKAALAAWQEASAALIRANDISGYAMRAPFAHALNDLGTTLLSMRMAGASTNDMIDVTLTKVNALNEKRFEAGDVPVKAITKWSSLYPRKAVIADAGSARVDDWMAAQQFITDRILLWLRDPAEGDRVVRSDPRVDGLDDES